MTSDLSDAAMVEGSTLAVRVRVQAVRHGTVRIGVEAREIGGDGEVVAKSTWSAPGARASGAGWT